MKDVEASLGFYVHRLGFMSAWRYDENGTAHVARRTRHETLIVIGGQCVHWQFGVKRELSRRRAH